MHLILYSREDCHLCEQALALLAEGGVAGLVREVDIEQDVELIRQYCLRIPVLRSEPGGRELDWPFDGPQLQAFLDENPG